MQGGGQEFESPRLHHLRPPGPTEEETRDRPETHPDDQVDGRPSNGTGRDPSNPCSVPSTGWRSPTSGSLGRRPTSCRPTRDSLSSGSHLNNWIVFRQIEDLRFRRVFKEISRNGSRPRLTAWSFAGGGQATKGTRWMPWRQEPMKDVAGCEKLRGVASRQ